MKLSNMSSSFSIKIVFTSKRKKNNVESVNNVKIFTRALKSEN